MNTYLLLIHFSLKGVFMKAILSDKENVEDKDKILINVSLFLLIVVFFLLQNEKGRIHGNPVVDGWAGAVIRKPLGIQKLYRRTDLPTDTAKCRVACPRLKRQEQIIIYNNFQ